MSRETGSPPRPEADNTVADDADAIIARALAAIAPPEHRQLFWSDVRDRLGDEAQLRLTPRAAIRPITQPPPLADTSTLRSHPYRVLGRRGRYRRRHRALAAAFGAVLGGLLVWSALGDSDDEAIRTSASSTTAPADAPTSDGPATTAPPPAPGPAGLTTTTPLAPGEVGPLRIGITLRELQDAGIGPAIDQRLFEGTGRTCFTATIGGQADLLLRFVSPDRAAALADPGSAVLGGVGVDLASGSGRATDTGIALAAPEEHVLSTYAGNIEATNHPFVPGGHIYLAAVGDGTGIAFATDSRQVTAITVGYPDVIVSPDPCG